MYATTTTYQWKAQLTDDRVAVIGREIIDVLARSPGFKAYYNVKVSDTQSFTFVLWDDQASADAARAVIAPAQARLTEDILAASPVRLAGEVFIQR